MRWYVQICKICLAFALTSVFPWWSPTMSKESRRALTPALRSRTRSVSRKQLKLKIFENSCPRQLLKLACTGLRCHYVGNITWQRWEIDIVLGYRCGVICVAMQGMLGSFFCLFFPWWFPNVSKHWSKHAQTQALRSQTRSGSGTQKKLQIFESSCPRQMLKLACTFYFSLCGKHCMEKVLG